jgi:hypothetical protein
LTERLSMILSELISKRFVPSTVRHNTYLTLGLYNRLPQIQEELQASLRRTEAMIRQLPKPPSADPFSEILGVLHVFIRDLEKHLEGTPKDGLMQSVRPAHQKFKMAIRSTAPDFRPYEKSYAATRSMRQPDFLDNEEDQSEQEDDAESSGSDRYCIPFQWLNRVLTNLFSSAEDCGDAAEECSDAADECSDVAETAEATEEPGAIYIDEVLARATEYATFFAFSSITDCFKHSYPGAS